MNKLSINKKRSFTILTIVLSVVLFIASFFGSFLSFSNNSNFSYRDLRSKLIKENEEELVLSTQTNYNEELWNRVYEENTSSEPFLNCASRLSKAESGDGQTMFLFDVPHYSDANYSYNHIYGYDYVWPKLKEGTIIVSSDFYNNHRDLENMTFITTSGSSITLKVIGYCEGKANKDRSHLGNLFADLFGYFGFITQSDMNRLNIDGFTKVISTKQHSRSFNLETKKWLSNYGFNLQDTSFSSNSINKVYNFLFFSSNEFYAYC